MASRPELVRRKIQAPLRRRLAGDRAATYLAAALVSWLVVGVPLGALALGLPVPALLVGGAVLYALAVAAAGVVFEGLCAALFVAVAFNVTAYVETSAVLGVNVRVVDLLALGCLGYLAIGARGEWPWLPGRDRRLVVGLFGAFVAWTYLTGVFGAGPSSAGAVQYADRQLRYLVVLVTATAVVARSEPRAVLGPLAIGLTGALAFATDEVFAGRAGYLVNFGFLGPVIERTWPAPSLTAFSMQSTVVYEGGPIGHSRTMVGLAILFAPLALAAATRSRRHVPLAAASLLALVSVVASSSDAGVVGLYAAVAPVVVYWLALAVDRAGAPRAARLVGPLAVALGAVVAVWAVLATASGAEKVLLVSTSHLDVRLEQYAVALELAARYPLFGVGGGGNVPLVTDRVIHNLYLQQLAATGVPGLLAYATGQAAATWLVLRRIRRCETADRWLWVGILGSLAGFYAYSFWVVAHWWDPVHAVYWTLVGVAIGASPPTDDAEGLREWVRAGLPFGASGDDEGS